MTDTFILSRTGAEVEELQKDYTEGLYPSLKSSVDYPVGMIVKYNGVTYIKKSNADGAISNPSTSDDWELKGTYLPRIEYGGGAAAFDENGALFVTTDLTSASATVGGSGWYRPDGNDRTYKDLTSSRIVGVTYTNDSLTEKLVFLTADMERIASKSFFVNGSRIGEFGSGNDTDPSEITQCFLVPRGATYFIESGMRVTRWVEYDA